MIVEAVALGSKGQVRWEPEERTESNTVGDEEVETERSPSLAAR